MLNFVGWLISIYQRTLSPDHGLLKGFFPGGVCRYTPTCSEYAHQAIAEHGEKGLALSVSRILRCHPFSRAEHYDPVPKSVNKQLV